MRAPKFSVFTFATAMVVVVAGIRFSTPSLELGRLASPLRLGSQAVLIGTALMLSVLFPSVAVGAFRRLPVRLLAAFCFFGALSTIWSADPLRTLSQALAGLSFVLIISMHSERDGWHAMRGAITRGFVAVLVLGVLVDIATMSGLERWAGVAGAPTQLAQFATMTGVLALVGWWRHRESTGFTFLVVALGFGTIIMSQSRVALLTLTLAVVVAVWVRAAPAVRTAVGVGLVSAVAAAVVVFANQTLQLALRDNSEASDLAEFTGRTSIWPEAIELISQRPFIGLGFASGETVWAERVLLGRLNWYPSNAHNIMLEVLMSVGAVGLVLLLASLASVLTASASTERAPASSLLFVVLVLGATEAILHYASPGLVVFAVAAALGGRAHTSDAPDSSAVAWVSLAGRS